MRSPSGLIPLVGTVTVMVSPAVTLAVKLRAVGGWFGVVGVGSGLTVTVTRPVTARSGPPSGYAAYSRVTTSSAVIGVTSGT